MDFTQFIINTGYIGLFAIIFAESGLFIGFFLPGDSLLFTAGFLAFAAPAGMGRTEPIFSLPVLIVGCFLAAVIGDSVGYMFGRRVGRRMFTKDDSLLFKRKYVEQAQAFYEQHGSKTIVIARFMPIVRTFAPIVAGIGEMKYSTFLTFNVIGGALWAIGLTLAGYFLGSAGKAAGIDVDKFILPIVVVIVLISVAPSAWHILKEKENRDSLMRLVTRRQKEQA